MEFCRKVKLNPVSDSTEEKVDKSSIQKYDLKEKKPDKPITKRNKTLNKNKNKFTLKRIKWDYV